MSKIVFVSYCHKQGEWVWNNLVPCLRAGGADVRIDMERFKAGKPVIGQMDATQDGADVTLLMLSPDYLASSYCMHEMNRAIKRNPQFKDGSIIPVKLVDCTIPDKIKKPNPVYVDLCNDKDVSQWNLLLQACSADLGADATDWLSARDAIARFLKRNQSVNLVVSGRPQWRALIEHLCTDIIKDLKKIDLESGATMSRRGLVAEILQICGISSISVPAEPEDLVELDRVLSARPISRLAITHFHEVVTRPYYDVNLFAALRYMLMESHKLVLLAQSRIPFAELLPQNHPLSSIDIQMVELRGR